jgi:hypothetical protein
VKLMPSDFTFASVGLMSGEPLSSLRPERRQIVEYSAINASETPLPVGLRPVSLLLPSTGAVQVGDRLVGGASPLERLVAASVAHVEAIASALPIDAEDERIVDELFSKRSASLRTRPLGPARGGSR